MNELVDAFPDGIDIVFSGGDCSAPQGGHPLGIRDDAATRKVHTVRIKANIDKRIRCRRSRRVELACSCKTIDLGIVQIKQVRVADSVNKRSGSWAVIRIVKIVFPHEVVQAREGMNHQPVVAGKLVAEDIAESPDALPVQRPVFGTEF